MGSMQEHGVRADAARFGPYRLSRLLGRGGMAEVWRATLEGERSELAVKRILPHLCDELPVVELFLSEARLAQRLQHPNLVRTLAAGLVGDQPYIAMELLDGVDLRSLLSGGPSPLPIGFCLSVVRDLCRALAYVHTLTSENGRPLGLIHRDISHSNVMVERDGTVKLLDFGVAKAALLSRGTRTRTGELKGKLGYLAPEVILGAPYDHRADLFAVGVMLHELLTGQKLFEAGDQGAVLWLNMQCATPAPSVKRPELTPRIDNIVLRALDRDPDRRFTSASELGRALDAIPDTQRWTRADTVALLLARAAAGTLVRPSLDADELPTNPSLPRPRVTPQRGFWLAGLTIAVIAGSAGYWTPMNVLAPALHASAITPPSAQRALDDLQGRHALRPDLAVLTNAELPPLPPAEPRKHLGIDWRRHHRHLKDGRKRLRSP